MISFALAQDGLAQLAEVEPGAGPVALVQTGPPLPLFGRKNHIVCLMSQLGRDPVNDQPGHVGGRQAGQEQAGLFLHGEVVRHSVLLDQVRELVGNPGRSVAAEGLVGQTPESGLWPADLTSCGQFCYS